LTLFGRITKPFGATRLFSQRFVIFTLAMILCAYARKSLASLATAQLAVTTTVVRSCTLSIAPLSFGNYQPLAANGAADLIATTSLSIACSRSTNPSVAISSGDNGPAA